MNRFSKFSMTALLVPIIMMGLYHEGKAQNARFGVKGGLNVSNFHKSNVDDKNARLGFHLGLYGQLPVVPDVFAIQPEVLYSTQGNKSKYTGAFDQTVKYNLGYIDVPVLAVFKLGKVAEIHAGVYGGYLVDANISYEGDIASGMTELDRDNFNKFDYGLVGGLGINFGAMQIGARYNYGLQKLANSNAADLALGDAKNSLAQIYLAINFAGE